MTITRQPYDADIPEGHAFVETRDFHPSDRMLRDHGFKIHARPRNGAAVWKLKGVLFTQEEAELRLKEKG
jgi:hypothetical protein